MKKCRRKLIILLLVSTTLLTLLIVGCTPIDRIDGIINVVNTHYSLDVAIDPNSNVVSVTADISGQYKGRPAAAIDLVMNANAFTDGTPVSPNEMLASYPVGASYGKVDIKEATINGRAATHELTSNVITIMTKSSKIDSGKLAIAIKYELKLPHTSLRYGYNIKSQSIMLANFYPQIARPDRYEPIGDPFYSEVADYDVNITCPSEYKLLASGDVSEVVAVGSNNTKYSYKASKIRDYAIVASKVARIKSLTSADGYLVNYMYHEGNAQDPDRQLFAAANSLDVYSEIFGSYHRKTLNVVDVDFAQGGMEFGGLIYIDKKLDAFNKELVVIHETAHQWWYGNVGSDQVNHPWQDEGLTEYSLELYFKHQCSVHNAQNDRAKMLNESARQGMKYYIDAADKLGIAYDNNMDRALSDYVSSNDYVYNTYCKGHLMYANINALMGDARFMAALREYYSSYLYKIASPQNLYAVFNKHYSGIEVLFKSYLSGSVINP